MAGDHVDVRVASAAMADVEVSYGSATKTLALQPLGKDTPGQFTGRLSGKIDQTDITPVEVQPADVAAFPKLVEEETESDGLGLAGWLGMGGGVPGLAGVAPGSLALARRK